MVRVLVVVMTMLVCALFHDQALRFAVLLPLRAVAQTQDNPKTGSKGLRSAPPCRCIGDMMKGSKESMAMKPTGDIDAISS